MFDKEQLRELLNAIERRDIEAILAINSRGYKTHDDPHLPRVSQGRDELRALLEEGLFVLERISFLKILTFVQSGNRVAAEISYAHILKIGPFTKRFAGQQSWHFTLDEDGRPMSFKAYLEYPPHFIFFLLRRMFTGR